MTMKLVNILSPQSHATATTSTSSSSSSSSLSNFESFSRAYKQRCASTYSPLHKPVQHRCVSSRLNKKNSASGCGNMRIQNQSNGYNMGSCYIKKQGMVCSALPRVTADVATIQDLFGLICAGPLLEKMGLTENDISDSIDKWLQYGLHLCRLFQLNELFLTIPQKIRIYQYYVPVFMWCEDQIAKHKASFKEGDSVPPLVIGFSAPQGCGKTTLVFALANLFEVTGRKIATISIDDFYLTAEDQAKLREKHPGNTLLELRGNAGSHDLSLSVETLTALTNMSEEGTKLKLPRYDKSAYSGKGDRADPSSWPEVEGPLTAVLFEGWMLGFKPVPVETVRAVDPQLEIVNKYLEAYYEAWDKFIKAWIVIKIRDPSCVSDWRLQAEIAMREAGHPGMTDEEVKDFVSRYLPAYKAYLPTLYAEGPDGSVPEHTLVIDIDEGRNPILGS